jgi:hypothetical protein
MATKLDSVKLSAAHADYLQAILATVGLPAGLTLNGQVLEGPRVAMEALGDRLTETLAERGFDEDYSTTAEGELIEGLIDALHRP